MATCTINVTQQDIDKGLRNNCCDCPVALAIKRTMNKRAQVFQCKFFVPGGRLRDLPEIAIDFVRNFDSCKPVSPFSFDLEIEHENINYLSD